MWFGSFLRPRHIFYEKIFLSLYSGVLETLVLGTKLIFNNFLFEKVLTPIFFGVIPFMNSSCTVNFEFNFDEAKKVVSNPDMNVSNFGPLIFQF